MAVKKTPQKKRKIAFIAGSRGEYGYIRPIIEEIQKRSDLDYGLIVSNMHVLDTFGSSIEEIKKDNLKIHAAIHNTLDGYNHLTMTKSLAIFLLQLPEYLRQMDADMLVISGDRGEQLMGAIAGAHMYIPVAHIQAGEISGNIDNLTRHAIAKYAHIHFAANKDAARRLIKMGEQSFRVHMVGAPQLDELVQQRVTPANVLYKKFDIDRTKPLFLIAQHPVTEEFDKAEHQIRETFNALDRFGHQSIVVLNNSDAGSAAMRNFILNNKRPYMRVVSNMPREDYLGLMRIADVLVGNSSSGLLEAPTFKLPAINIGTRQYGRVRGTNVIDVRTHSAKAIVAGITKALSTAFKKKIKQCTNPYGDGRSARRIVDVLQSTPIDEKLLVKRITY